MFAILEWIYIRDHMFRMSFNTLTFKLQMSPSNYFSYYVHYMYNSNSSLQTILIQNHPLSIIYVLCSKHVISWWSLYISHAICKNITLIKFLNARTLDIQLLAGENMPLNESIKLKMSSVKHQHMPEIFSKPKDCDWWFD